MDQINEEEEKVITMEGSWDEDISIEEIHEQILENLKEEIEELKDRYRQLSSTAGSIHYGQDMRILRKITSVRLKHDKLVANAKHIFDELKSLRGKAGNPTPCTRLQWMNHVQDYFRYLNDMFHIDVSLNRISPGLFRSAKISGTDTPGTFSKKCRMTIILQKLIEYEKHNKKATAFNSRMKKYSVENLTTIPKRFMDPSTGCNNGKGFPDRWLELFDEEFRGYFSQSKDTVYRWYLLFSLIGTEKFSQLFEFHGLCPSCSYPFIFEKSLKTHNENKLSCKECMKEIDWTYFASTVEMKTMRNFLHPKVLGDIDDIIKQCSPSKDEIVEPSRQEVPKQVEPLQDAMVIKNEPIPDADTQQTIPVVMKKPLTNKRTANPLQIIHNDNNTDNTTVVDTNTSVITETTSATETTTTFEKPARKRGRRKEHDIDKIIHIARQELKSCPTFVEKQPLVEDISDKNYDGKIKDAVSNLLIELKNFQGFSLEKIPQGVFQSVESYLVRVHKIPPKDKIRIEPINDKGERVLSDSNFVISRRLVLEALKECGLNKWSSHISHIMATLWWCPYPKIEFEDEQNMLITVVKQREIFERIKDKFARKSNLSVFTAIGKLLTYRGYPFEDTDFKIWESQDSKKKQDLMWDECVKEFIQ